MRRTDQGTHWAECPLCGRQVFTWSGVPWMPGHITRGQITCDGSGKTYEDAEELAAFRLRAHP